MRLFRALPTLSLLLGASTSSLDSRQSNAHPLDVREVNDVCAPVNVDLQAPNLLGNLLGASGVIGQFKPRSLDRFQGVLTHAFDRCLPLSLCSPPVPRDERSRSTGCGHSRNASHHGLIDKSRTENVLSCP
jgi:hypothetical protein